MNNQAPSFAERLAFQADKMPGRITKPRQRHTASSFEFKTWRGASNVSKAWR